MDMGLEDDDSDVDDDLIEELELRSCFVQGPSSHCNGSIYYREAYIYTQNI